MKKTEHDYQLISFKEKSLFGRYIVTINHTFRKKNGMLSHHLWTISSCRQIKDGDVLHTVSRYYDIIKADTPDTIKKGTKK